MPLEKFRQKTDKNKKEAIEEDLKESDFTTIGNTIEASCFAGNEDMKNNMFITRNR